MKKESCDIEDTIEFSKILTLSSLTVQNFEPCDHLRY